MHQIDKETSTDLFLTKACEEAWLQRVSSLTNSADIPLSLRDISSRCFALSNGRVVFGLSVAEISDSYLVALPAVLVDNNGVIRGTSLVSEPLVRIFKSNLLFVSGCSAKHLPAYSLYLYEKRNIVQGLLPESMISDISAAAKEYLVDISLKRADTVDADVDEEEEGEEIDKSSSSSIMGVYKKSTTRH